MLNVLRPAASLRITTTSALLATLLLAGCAEDTDSSGTPQDGSKQTADWDPTAPVFHDFGVILHGDVRAADLRIPIPEDGPWIPLAFSNGCPCASQEWVVIEKDGGERVGIADGRRDPNMTPGEGEKLILRLTIDTNWKPAQDLDPYTVAGQVVFGHADVSRRDRAIVPVRFRYGIDAPFQLIPGAVIDLGTIPRSQQRREQVRVVHGPGELEFSRPIPLKREAGQWVPTTEIDAKILPGEDDSILIDYALRVDEDRPDGPFAFRLASTVSLGEPFERFGDEYVLEIQLTGRIRPDLSTGAPHRFHFGRLKAGETGQLQMIVEDYDFDRDAEFVSLGVRDPDGNSLDEHFEVEIEPLRELPRRSTVILRYLGKFPSRSFDGSLHLTKKGLEAAVLKIPVKGFVLPPR